LPELLPSWGSIATVAAAGWDDAADYRDVHEVRSGVPAQLAGLGAAVEIGALTRGDYLVAVNALVERKTIADLHSSIVKGRFWAQMAKIRVSRRAYLMLEGRSLFGGPVADEALRGLCVAVADLGVTIIRTENARDTAAWLIEIAAGGAPIRDRPVFAQRPQSTDDPPAVVALSSAPGVSVETARSILARFETLTAVSQAHLDDLRRVPGVGAKKAEAIFGLFHERQALTRSN
jgi:ERCC4-type nuclease